MGIKDDFLLREVAGQAVVIATGAASETFHGMIKLNETGAAIWRALDEGLTEQQVVAHLCEDFAVTPEQASADVEAFVARLQEQGLWA